MLTASFLATGYGIHKTAADDDNIAEVAGWRATINPFSTNAGATGNSISGSAQLDSGVRVHLAADCKNGRIRLRIGIANGQFDIETHDVVHRQNNTYTLFNIQPDTVYTTRASSINVHQKLDQNDSSTLTLTPDTPSTVSFNSYDAKYFVAGTDYLLGFPMDGTEVVLHTSLKDATARSFFSRCTAAVQREEMEKQSAALRRFEQAPVMRFRTDTWIPTDDGYGFTAVSGTVVKVIQTLDDTNDCAHFTPQQTDHRSTCTVRIVEVNSDGTPKKDPDGRIYEGNVRAGNLEESTR